MLVLPRLVLAMVLANGSNGSFSSIQSDLDPTALIPLGGVIGVATIIFVETGLFFGFLPGDSLAHNIGDTRINWVSWLAVVDSVVDSECCNLSHTISLAACYGS